jgi:hypothetical protein
MLGVRGVASVREMGNGELGAQLAAKGMQAHHSVSECLCVCVRMGGEECGQQRQSQRKRPPMHARARACVCYTPAQALHLFLLPSSWSLAPHSTLTSHATVERNVVCSTPRRLQMLLLTPLARLTPAQQCIVRGESDYIKNLHTILHSACVADQRT